MQSQVNSSRRKWTILDIINWTTTYFTTHKIDSPRASAEIFLADILGLRRIDLYLRYDQPLTDVELSRFKAYIKRRINREPVAYITGKKEFWSMELSVSSHTLIPRPETECLVEEALSCLPESITSSNRTKQLRILELGTGSGAIILAIAKEKPGHRFYALDQSSDAIQLARINAKTHHQENHIHFFVANWMSALKGLPIFDFIVSNPPYIPSNTIPTLQPEISKYEPLTALDGGENGLLCIKTIIHLAHNRLNTNGILLLEMGYDQKEGIEEIIHACGRYKEVVFSKDYGGNHRIVRMQKK